MDTAAAKVPDAWVKSGINISKAYDGEALLWHRSVSDAQLMLHERLQRGK